MLGIINVLLFIPLALDGMVFFPILIHWYLRLSAPLALHDRMTFIPTETVVFSSGLTVISTKVTMVYRNVSNDTMILIILYTIIKILVFEKGSRDCNKSTETNNQLEPVTDKK